MDARGEQSRGLARRRGPGVWSARLLALFVSAAVAMALPTSWARAEPTVTTQRDAIVVTTDDDGAGSASLAINVDAPTSGTIRLAIEDAVLDGGGRWAPRPAGTTPYTLDERLGARPASLRYEGDDVGARVAYVIDLEVDAPALQTPIVGLVTVTFEPDTAGSEPPVPAQTRIAAWPAELDTPPVAVALDDLAATPAARWRALDQLRSVLPRVLDRDALTLEVTTVNTGDAAVAASTTLQLIRSGPLGTGGLGDDDALVTVEGPEQLLFPDERSTSGVQQRRVDELPLVGFVRLEATTVAALGQQEVVSTQGRTYLVAPWQEALAVVAALLLVAIGWRIRRHRSHPASTPPTDERSAGEPAAAGLATPDPTTHPPTPDPAAAPPTPDPTADPPTPDPTDDPPTTEPATAPPTPDPPTPDPTADPATPHPAADPPTPDPFSPGQLPDLEPPTDEPTGTDADAQAKQIVAEILTRIEADRASRARSDADGPGTAPAQREPGT